MYNELDYVVNTFKENFKNTEEPLILYGLGVVTEGLLKNISEYNVVGLMDGKRKSGEQWGIKILDYADVVLLNVKTIIIVAKQPAIPVIFHRIENFCKAENIMVYDINGVCMADVYSDFENSNPYFDVDMNDLKLEINQHDIISFDIFDTLLVRRVLNPKDVFQYIELILKQEMHDFKFLFGNFRVQAEKNLLKKHLNPTIYAIYDEFQRLTNITDEEKKYLIKKEVEIELAMIKPRKTMLQLFNEIKGIKKIYLVSDMYLTKEILDNILKKNGYQGYTDIIVSCDYNKSKKEGLFEYLKNKIEKDKKILHIGDNYSADIAPLQESSIDTFYIMSERDMLANSSYRRILDLVKSVADAVIAGRFANVAFDNPFELYHTKGRLKISKIEKYIDLFIAPMIFYYAVWIMKTVKEVGCDYILYTSRDGYLIKKIIELMKEEYKEYCAPDGIYFYASRRACLAATIYSYDDVKQRVFSNYKGDIYSLFRDRFGIKIDEDARNYSSDEIEKVLYYAKKYEDEILKCSQKERENYLAYIRDCKIQEYKRVAVIDLVAKGTVQNELTKLLSNCSLVGMYFFKTDADSLQINPEIEFCSLYQPQGKYSQDCPNVYRLYRQIELVLTSDEPTFHSIKDNGKKQFMKELRSKRQIQVVKYVQQIVLEYVANILKLLKFDFTKNINGVLLDEILGLTDSQYSRIEVEELSNMILYSEVENLKFTITENL